MKQVLVTQGRTAVEEVPAPVVDPGTVLVRLEASCISIGTEMSALRSSGLPLWKRALQQPKNIGKVLRMVNAQGAAAARNFVENQVAAPRPSGYSAAGVVLEVGREAGDFEPGDRVACAGAQCAHHAEVVSIPRNLAVPIPEGLSFQEASTVTLGAIALQGVRRASPTLGETFVVIGLGVVGQLVVQLLRANGCRVIGSDLDQRRIALARELGMDLGLEPEDDQGTEQVARLTDGIGADGVVITAASSSDAIVNTAFRMCRKKGRVVLVGDVGLRLDRSDFYYKELDFFISTSYGPGRYDQNYEEEGLDYPVGYVRWTENRNMAEYLRLLSEKRVRVGPLISGSYPIEKASTAYEALKGGSIFPPMLLLDYPPGEGKGELKRVVFNPAARAPAPGRVTVAVVGAGSFAKNCHLPNLRALSDVFSLAAVVSHSGHNALATARRFGAAISTTDYQAVLDNPQILSVILTTRHHLHAGMALEALKRGKHVLVEKPLALDRESLQALEAWFNGLSPEAQVPLLLTGFNRRFSPHCQRIREIVANRTNPMILNYRMNAGHVPLEHWMHGEEGGGRNIGEACHIYDLFTFLTGSMLADLDAKAIDPSTGYYTHRDNFVATMRFGDGSVATLTYTALGSPEHPKEELEVFVDGKVLCLDNYRSLTVRGARAKGTRTRFQEKGHREELQEFGRAITSGGPWPSPLWQQVQAMEIAFRVEEMLRANA